GCSQERERGGAVSRTGGVGEQQERGCKRRHPNSGDLHAGDGAALEVVSKSRRQALRSCAVGLFLVSNAHARRSGKAGTPFLRPLQGPIGRRGGWPQTLTGAGPRSADRPRLWLRRAGAWPRL